MVTPDDTKFTNWHYEFIHHCRTEQMKKEKKRHRPEYKTIVVQRLRCGGWHLVGTVNQIKQSGGNACET